MNNNNKKKNGEKQSKGKIEKNETVYGLCFLNFPLSRLKLYYYTLYI